MNHFKVCFCQKVVLYFEVRWRGGRVVNGSRL